MNGGTPFNVRVYGLLFDEEERSLLLSYELLQGRGVTKFPGGGLEFGEGPEDCVIREFQEEAGVDVRVEEHFYTTGFFQRSAFDPKEQVISIYYRVSLQKGELDRLEEGLFWKPLSELDPDLFELPIDRHVAKALIRSFNL